MKTNVFIRPLRFGVHSREFGCNLKPMSASLLTLTMLAMLAPQESVGQNHGARSQGSPEGSYLRAADFRVATIVHRLATRGTAFCDATHPVTGFLLHHLDEYAHADRAEAVRRFGLDEGAGVLAVVAGSAAAQAGLAAGDLLLSINGVQLPRSAQPSKSDARAHRKVAEEADALVEQQMRGGSATLEISRMGEPISIMLKPVIGCAARGRLARSSQANAFADGRYAIMTTKMLEFVQNDDELAVVMAHEIAHNLLAHPARLEAQKVPHGILRGIGKNASRVRSTEEEADRLALKLLWSAGYDLGVAIPFWRRLYTRYDPIPIPKLFRTHPSLSARERLIRDTIGQLSGSEAGSR